MKKFLVLYRSTMSAKEQMMKVDPEQAKASMDAWAGSNRNPRLLRLSSDDQA
jgi:hypothetical protein